jgi:hypothetical protein
LQQLGIGFINDEIVEEIGTERGRIMIPGFPFLLRFTIPFELLRILGFNRSAIRRSLQNPQNQESQPQHIVVGFFT